MDEPRVSAWTMMVVDGEKRENRGNSVSKKEKKRNDFVKK